MCAPQTLLPTQGTFQPQMCFLNFHQMTHTPGKESVLQIRNDLKSKQLSTLKFFKYLIINTVDPLSSTNLQIHKTYTTSNWLSFR